MSTMESSKRTAHIEAKALRWSPSESADLYGVRDWGAGYFHVFENGRLAVAPGRDPDHAIDLFELVEGLSARGISTPVLIRFNDILTDRIRGLHDAFAKVIDEAEYKGRYRFVYPIKVNQQRHVCEHVRDANLPLGFGLEVGSKPELVAVLGMTAGMSDMPFVCNGFKDDEYVETVILATKLGRTIYPIVERFSELELIVKHARAYGVRPRIGVRMKPSSTGTGRWHTSTGDRSKFGLSTSALLEAVEYLKQYDMADCLNVLHFHLGSQVSDIRAIKGAIGELGHVYAELRRLGAGISIVNVGGGLGVDYDGSASPSDSSVNYGLSEYAGDVVWRLKAICDEAGVPHPDIFSESGRAMLAHASVLVTDVLGQSRFPSDPDMASIESLIQAESASDGPPQPLLDLVDAYKSLGRGGAPIEVYHDAVQARGEIMSLFNLGYASLPVRAAAERLFAAIGRGILAIDPEPESEELWSLQVHLSDTYFVNLSTFQSLPDHWAIDQLFPVMPIHRLETEPTRRGVLADVTCDSDGAISQFIGSPEPARFLPLHELSSETYYLGFFLLGAYQEVLGDLHNLFGDTHAVHVTIDPESKGESGTIGWHIEELVEGDTVKEVLNYVQYDHEQLRRNMRLDVERAVREGRMTVAEGRSLRSFYDHALEGYTYLE